MTASIRTWPNFNTCGLEGFSHVVRELSLSLATALGAVRRGCDDGGDDRIANSKFPGDKGRDCKPGAQPEDRINKAIQPVNTNNQINN